MLGLRKALRRPRKDGSDSTFLDRLQRVWHGEETQRDDGSGRAAEGIARRCGGRTGRRGRSLGGDALSSCEAVFSPRSRAIGTRGEARVYAHPTANYP